jgi:hypothetical protein
MITDLLDLTAYLETKVDQNKGELGVEFVSFGEERLIPSYPAILVIPGTTQREWHTTHRWRVTLTMEIWVYHAKLSESRRTRNRLDMGLVKSTRELLHNDLRLRDTDGVPQCVSSWINLEEPAFIRRPRGEAVVGTRMEHTTISEEVFK